SSRHPTTCTDQLQLPVCGGSKQRRNADVWFAALAAARQTPNPPPRTEAANGPPPVVRWAKKKPEAAARLEVARAAVSTIAEQVSVPTENLLAPDLLRRLCWDWDDRGAPGDTAAAVEAVLRAGQARPWQRELVTGALAAALARPAPR